MVLARMRAGFRGSYDAFFYDDRVALRRVPGADAERIGGLIGFVLLLGWLGAIIGSWIGRRIAADSNAGRIQPLEWKPAIAVAEGDPKNRVIPYQSIAAVRVDVEGGSAWIRLREADGRKSRFHCYNVHNPHTDVVALLRSTIGPQVKVRRRRLGPLVVVGASVVIAVFLGRLLLTTAFASNDGAKAHARTACRM